MRHEDFMGNALKIGDVVVYSGTARGDRSYDKL